MIGHERLCPHLHAAGIAEFVVIQAIGRSVVQNREKPLVRVIGVAVCDPSAGYRQRKQRAGFIRVARHIPLRVRHAVDESVGVIDIVACRVFVPYTISIKLMLVEDCSLNFRIINSPPSVCRYN